MALQELFIKNMVCDRCIRVVQTELERLGFLVAQVELGKATIDDRADARTLFDLAIISSMLEQHGFALITDKTTRIVNQVKTLIIDLIQSGRVADLRITLSDYLADHIGLDYAHMSHLFSTTENLTIEKFWILQRVERAKELLSYNEIPISDITKQLGYSSVAYLTNQFKQVTGLTPAAYRSQHTTDRMQAEQTRPDRTRPDRSRPDRNPLDWI